MTQVVLITGASSGIGQATAEHLARQGYRVFGTSRRPAQAQARGFTLLPLDVTDPATIAACVQQVIAQAGRLDVLVNNAALVGPAAAAEEISLAQWRALFETNFFGWVAMTNAALAVMRPQRSGRIINISSLAGFMAGPVYFGPYVATKHALEGYTEALRYEVAQFNISVTLIELGYMATQIGQTLQPPDHPLPAYAADRERIAAVDKLSIERGRDPALVAAMIARIIAAPAPALRYQVGLEARLMWVLTRLLPFRLVERFMHWLYLEGDWQPDRLGLRALFMDTRAADRANRLSLAGLGILAALLVMRGLRRR